MSDQGSDPTFQYSDSGPTPPTPPNDPKQSSGQGSPVAPAGDPGPGESPQVEAPTGRLATIDVLSKRLGGWMWGVGAVVSLVLFVIMYSLGAAINSASSEKEPTVPRVPVPDAVSPSPLPTEIVRPGIPKSQAAEFRSDVDEVVLTGATFASDTEILEAQGLPFAIQVPGDLTLAKFDDLGASSYAIYRRVTLGGGTVKVGIAAHPCADRAGCLADRSEFDARWTKQLKGVVPKTARDDGQTWFTEVKSPYQLAMTRAYRSPQSDSWWLVGVTATASPGAEALAQSVLNDIRTQTS